MRCKILGSWGAIPTPRPFGSSSFSNKARKNLEMQRDCSCFWIEDIQALVDCPETVGHSANKAGLDSIENLFITHWHPDHCFGLRLVLESRYDFYTNTAMPLNLYLPKTVYEDIKKVYPSIDFFIEVKKCANLILMQEGQEVMIHNMTVQAIGYTQDDPHWFAYLFSQNDKSLLYLPCDTIGFTRALPPVDVLVHECWIFSPEVKDELSFEQMLVRIKKAAPWKVIVTHIEEIELARYPERFEALEQEYQDINLFLGYDGMEIQL